MRYSTTAYMLLKENEKLYFPSEKDACKYLSVQKSSVCSCFLKGRKCKGFVIKRIGRTSHLSTQTRLFKIWEGMKERCSRIKHPHFSCYGGKGISVCDEWKDFATFKEWAISSGYNNDLTIDRLDNSKGYSPENCRWATIKEQSRNKTTNHLITYNNKTKTISQWAEDLNINYTTLKYRICAGWDISKAFCSPVRCRTKGYRVSKMDEKPGGDKVDEKEEQKE